MFELNNWGYYEISFISQEERSILSHKLGMAIIDLSCFYKEGDDWIRRHSGMSFNIKHLRYYPKLKKYLDKELTIYLRKLKIQNINNL